MSPGRPQQAMSSPNSPSPSNVGSQTPAHTTSTTGGSHTPAAATSFMDILEAWRQFNVEKKKTDLDAYVTQIAQLKEDCVQSRKVLAKQTQDFKKVADEEKIKTFGALLKLYQDEVDKLTKRSKYSETCFFGVYKDISEAHDPVPALTAALDEYSKVDTTSKLEIENKRLQLELAEFRKEFQEIQNQEVTIRRLEDKIKDYEVRFEASTQEKIMARENELRQEYKSKMHTVKDRNSELTRQISQLQDDLNKVSRSHDQNQTLIFDVKTKHDEELSSKQGEIDMLTNEIERISSKLSSLQAENSSIREESIKEKSNITPLVKRIAELELECLQKDSEMSKLSDQCSEAKAELKEEMDALQEAMTQLEIEKQKVEKMDRHIQNNPSPADYENIKRELATLQAIVGSDEVAASSANQQNTDKLHKDKNRALENECTKLRHTLGTYETELEECRRRIEQLESIKTDQMSLIQRLEEDIGGSGGNLRSSSSHTSVTHNQDISSLIQQSPPILSLNASSDGQPTVTATPSKDDKMMDIVIGQRDRFKAKILELESVTIRI
eukprot:gene18960-22696_t